MAPIIITASLALALPLAVVAFYLGNFTVLMGLCAYVTVASLVICSAALRQPDDTADLFELE